MFDVLTRNKSGNSGLNYSIGVWSVVGYLIEVKEEKGKRY